MAHKNSINMTNLERVCRGGKEGIAVKEEEQEIKGAAHACQAIVCVCACVCAAHLGIVWHTCALIVSVACF